MESDIFEYDFIYDYDKQPLHFFFPAYDNPATTFQRAHPALPTTSTFRHTPQPSLTTLSTIRQH